jgi:hypothetical protein
MSHAKTNQRQVEDSAAKHGVGESQEALVELAALDAVRVGPGTARTFEAGSDGLEVLIFGARVAGDAEIVDGFWTD